MADTGEDGSTERVTLFDALIYAPIGLFLDGQELTPDLAKRGKQHAVAARQIGELAVKSLLRKVEESQSPDSDPEDLSAEKGAEPTSDKAAPASSDDDDRDNDVGDGTEQAEPTSEHLGIPDYDLLAASQVVKRLDALSPEELEAIRVYESATRDRRTILHKITRLQGD
ncbi:MAG: hypothetical protein ACR2PK_03830 [Acidimicrobiales bacterium]